MKFSSSAWMNFLEEETSKFSRTTSVLNHDDNHVQQNVGCWLSAEKSLICFLKSNNILKADWIIDYFKNRDTRRTKLDKEIANEMSQLHRKKGNIALSKQNDSKAMELYNKAILCAAPYSSPLGLAYGNRSYLLYLTKNFEHCLADIARALSCDHVISLSRKLNERKDLCLTLLNSDQNLSLSTKVPRACATKQGGGVESKVLLGAPLSDPCQPDFVNNILAKNVDNHMSLSQNTPEESIPKNDGDDCALVENLPILELPSDCMGHKKASDLSRKEKSNLFPEDELTFSKLMPSQSSITQVDSYLSSLEICYRPDKGRHVLSREKLGAGTLLIEETPFATVLLPEYAGIKCHQCLSSLISPVPCHACSDVWFCSEQCRDEAQRVYHHFECGFLELFESVGIAHLAFRVVVTAGLSSIQDAVDSKISAAHVYKNKYAAVYSLLSHAEKLSSEDLFQYGLTACLMMEVFCQTQWLQAEHYDLMSRVMLHHVCQLVSNAHAITELVEDKGGHEDCKVVQVQQCKIATAIYPSVSLLNHSCRPNVISSFQGNRISVRSETTIAEGEQVFNCYGPHADRLGRADRQRALREQYFFDCDCPACQLQDPPLTEALVCRRCRQVLTGTTRCPHCDFADPSLLDDLRSAACLFRRAVSLMQSGSHAEALLHLNRCLEKRSLVLHPDNKEMGEVVDAMARCHAATGNFIKSAELLETSSKLVSQQYGMRSCEYAYELEKLAGIMIQAGLFLKALEKAEQALSVLRPLYGVSHKSVVQLMEMRDFCSLNLDHQV